MFAKNIGMGGSAVSEILEASIKRGIFDKTLYGKYGILTSRGIQKRYFEAVSRRKSVEAKKQYLLINVTQNYKNVNISAENASTNSENVYISKQSKVKESKEKKSKESTIVDLCPEQNAPALPPAILLTLNDKTEYPIYQSQIDEWTATYQAVDVMQELRKMKAWLDANPTRRKTKRGILRFANLWLSKAQDKGGSRPAEPGQTPWGYEGVKNL